jgi:hypothetical protein
VSEPCFAITFRDHRTGEAITLRAREIRDSTLGIAFVAISGFVFDRSGLIVNPADEALARRFEHTKTLHLSIHVIHAIEELGADHQGLSFDSDRSKVVLFPPAPGGKT